MPLPRPNIPLGRPRYSAGMSLPTNTSQATIAAILAAGQDKRSSTIGGIDHFRPPPPRAELDPSLLINNSIAVHARVAFHGDPRARTVELKIDLDTAPLTGLYVFEIAGPVPMTTTYDATAEAPANHDELLQGWADAIASDNADYTAIALSSTRTGSDPLDTVRVVAPTGNPTYTTFEIGAATSAPEGAKLAIARETNQASVRLWLYPGYKLTNETQMTRLQYDQAVGPVINGDLGVRPPGGWEQQANLANIYGAWVELYSPVDADTIPIVVSGDGVYSQARVAMVVIAPTKAP